MATDDKITALIAVKGNSERVERKNIRPFADSSLLQIKLEQIQSSNMFNEIIVFEVPSADCFISKYLQTYNFSPTRYIESGRHNIFFSREVIRQIAENFSLKIEYIESNGLDVQTILLEEFDTKITDKIINIQDTLNDLLLGDHYRVFLRK